MVNLHRPRDAKDGYLAVALVLLPVALAILVSLITDGGNTLARDLATSVPVGLVMAALFVAIRATQRARRR